MNESVAPPPAAPRHSRSRWRWALRALAVLLVALAATAATLFAWLRSPAALDFVVQEITARSGGTLRLEGAEGSLLSTLQARSLTYRDGDFSVVAENVALEWSPAALWSRTLRIRGLGAQKITVTLAPTAGPTPLPATLALPFEVAIDHAAAAEVVLVDGASRQVLRGVTLGYRGGATAHQITGASVTIAAGRFDGFLQIAAAAPFPVGGALDFTGADGWEKLRARASIGGRLEALDLALAAEVATATAGGHARITPFADSLLPSATIDVQRLDLAALDAGLPHTAIAGTFTAALAADGSVAGTLQATNGDAGPYDRERLPLTALSTRYVATADTLELSDLAAEAGPRARARGSARIPLAQSGGFGSWRLELAQLDLARLHTALVPTQLSGRFNAVLSATGQQLDGDLAQDNLGLAFAATVSGNAIDVTRLQARAGAGQFTGRARYDGGGTRRFAVEGKAQRFDPSQLGRFPAARLDGDLQVVGELAPTWSADAVVTLAPSSRFGEAALSGTARVRVTATTLQDARIDVRLGGAQLQAAGSLGRAGDRMEVNVDVPDLDRLRVLLAEWVPAALPATRGRLRGKATFAGSRDDLALTFEARGENLQQGGVGVGTLDVKGDIGAPSQGRPLAVGATATKLTTPAGRYASATAGLRGTLAAHALTLAIVGDDVDANLRFEGGLADGRWRGTLAALRNRGTYQAELAAPARLEFGAGQVELADARLAIAEGSLRVGGLRWSDGRLTTEGAFDAIPLSAVARMAGTPLPLRSTLVLGGEWNLAATPRLNGTLAVRRQRGDLHFGSNAALEAGEVALGLSQLDLQARVVDDAVTATLDARATRLGTLRGQVALDRGPEPGQFDGNAPLTGRLVAELDSLQPLQIFLGTAALADGRATADLQLRGTLREASVSGTLNGTGLKLDAPQYGLHWGDGLLRARLGEGRLTLDEFSFRAGEGRFAASGVIAAAPPQGDAAVPVGAGTQLTWRAERLRATNRPDLRLIVSGDGQLAFADRHLVVSGALKVDEGSVDIQSNTGSALGDDVVIVGRPRPPPASAKRFGSIPFGVDLDVDLGPRLLVTGEGLETRAAGKVRVHAVPDGTLSAKGVIRAVNGTYYAFGQRLSVERGRLIFDGPIDNPALDVVALRKNLQVEAGVRVTGTARVPRVELTSEPPVPDGEKLSWLVLGQGLNQTTSGADSAALQAAAATLFGGGRVPIGTTLARSVGLDDIAVRGGSSMGASESSATGASTQVIAVSKRLSDKLYIVYEQGLSVANNALKIEYALTRRITLRAEAGLISGVGIYYRRSFE